MPRMASPTPPSISGLPQLRWLNGVVGDAESTDESIAMRTGPKTDWFNPPPSPTSPAGLSNAPALVFTAPPGDWQLSAKVTVNHRYLFDAATLFVYRNNNEWCKLCYEYSPENKPTIVSVVTRDVSDDCNGAAVDGGSVHMRISKYGGVDAAVPMLAFHYSIDGGRYWTLHRAFCMRPSSSSVPCEDNGSNEGEELSVGFLAQCPTGETCATTFSDIKFRQSTLKDLRDGS